jgi:hypothetical protein
LEFFVFAEAFFKTGRPLLETLLSDKPRVSIAASMLDRPPNQPGHAKLTSLDRPTNARMHSYVYAALFSKPG